MRPPLASKPRQWSFWSTPERRALMNLQKLEIAEKTLTMGNVKKRASRKLTDLAVTADSEVNLMSECRWAINCRPNLFCADRREERYPLILCNGYWPILSHSGPPGHRAICHFHDVFKGGFCPSCAPRLCRSNPAAKESKLQG